MIDMPRVIPGPPAIDLDHEEEDLEQGVGIELRVAEDEEIERYHDDPERVVPSRTAHDQDDVNHAQRGRNDFESPH